MKKILFLFFLIIRIMYAQNIDTLSQENKYWILSNLNSKENVNTAIWGVIKYKIVEAQDSITKYIWDQRRANQSLFVKALQVIGSPMAHSYALALIDSINDNPLHGEEWVFPEEDKVNVTETLFNLGDYSTAQSIFDLLDKYKPQVTSFEALKLLPKIIKNVPALEGKAKSELIYSISNASDPRDRIYALNRFYDLYKDEAKPYIIQMFTSDSSVNNRGTVLLNYLNRYKDLDNLYKQRLYQEENATLRNQIIRELLTVYGSPSDYQFVMNYISNEPDQKYKRLIKLDLQVLALPKLDSSKTESILLSDLIDMVDTTYNYNWIGDITLKDNLQNELQSAKTNLENGDSLASTINLKTFQDKVDEVYADSLNLDPRFVTLEGWKFLHYNAQYILDKLPAIPEETGFNIKLINSSGSLIIGGSLKYYEGGWKDAVDNGDGTFKITTEAPSVSLRMTYAYGSQTVSNVPAQNNIYTFQTVNTNVELQNSHGNLIDEGTVKYYAGAWRDFGTTVSGIASKELLPGNYSFRMTYAYASNDKQQNIGTDPTVVFQTVNANVQLQNSQGNLITEEGNVKYYAGAWRDFGNTVNGSVSKELLPNNYSFRMTYAYANNDKQQNIGTDPTIIFQTVNANVRLQNSQGNLINEEANVKYYAGAWRDFGNTVNGSVSKELLPNNYSFRITYEYISNDKQQDIGSNNIVDFSTVLCTVKVKDVQNQLVDNADVKYYAGAWRQFGTTANGEASKELLPSNISFRASAGGASQDKQQNIGDNSLVEINLP